MLQLVLIISLFPKIFTILQVLHKTFFVTVHVWMLTVPQQGLLWVPVAVVCYTHTPT